MLQNYIQSSRTELAKPVPDTEVREIAVCVHNILAAGGDIQEAKDLLDMLFQHQIMDAEDANYGNFEWKIGSFSDQNSVSFTMIETAALMLRYGDRLGTAFIESKSANLDAAAYCLMNFDCPIYYTNIYVLNFGSLLMLGELLCDPVVTADGKNKLDNWLSYTQQNGISEYVSPTYTAVQLTGLSFAHNNIKDLSVKGKLRMAIDFIWKDIAANSFRGQGSYGPSWSRAANFVGSSGGGIDWVTYMEGLRDKQSFTHLFPTGSRYFVNFLEGGYRPSEEMLQIANTYPRTVKQTWEYPIYSSYDRDRYNYVTEDFAISNSNGFYSPYDKQIAVHLASDSDLPAISVVSEFWNAPYGKTVRSSTGKPVHLRNDASYVQDKGTILALMDVTAYEDDVHFEYINTHILFPLYAEEIWFNSQRLDTSFEITGENQALLFIKEADSAVGVRIFHASGLYDFQPEFEISSDGEPWNVARMTVRQYQGESKAFNRDMDARVGVFLAAERVENNQDFIDFKNRFSNVRLAHVLDSNNIWTASVVFKESLLDASLNIDSGLAEGRAVNDEPYSIDGFSINNQSITMGSYDLEFSDNFIFADDETVVYESDFTYTDANWTFDNDMIIEGGVLKNAAQATGKAYLNISNAVGNTLGLSNGTVNIYASVKFNGTDHADQAGLSLVSKNTSSAAPIAGSFFSNRNTSSKIGVFADDSENTIIDPVSLLNRIYLSVSTKDFEHYKLEFNQSGEDKLSITLYRDSSKTGEWVEITNAVLPTSSQYAFDDVNLLGSEQFDKLMICLLSPGEYIDKIAITQTFPENFAYGDFNNDGESNYRDFTMISSIGNSSTTYVLLESIILNWLR